MAAPSHRQLRVAEELRHAFGFILGRGDFRSRKLYGTTITVTEVTISPDLRNATIYIMPLAGRNQDETLEALKEEVPHLRHEIAQAVRLRFVPEIRFVLDKSFDHASEVARLLKSTTETHGD